ncbi:MAG: WYL domain-containing protein [Novosphingobium sp.]
MALRDFILRAVRPKIHERFGKILDVDPEQFDDLDDELVLEDATGLESLSGLNLIIEYEDAQRKFSQRVITCKQLQIRAGKQYVQAFCHHRQAPRAFRIDRIKDIFDPITGETLSPVQAFFAQFSPDRVTKSGLSWGLSVGRRADLIAMLNALVFLARCDKEFHPAELRSIEEAITKYWIEFEIISDCDLEDILNYSKRLSPDGETFWLSLQRFKEEAVLARVFRRSARHLIEADGIIQREEAYWAIEIDDFLNDT